MPDEDEISNMINNLVMSGYLDMVGIDENSGEFLYSVSPELKEMIPHFAEMMEQAFLADLQSLWVSGFLKMDITELNPTVSLTALAFDEEAVKGLPAEEQLTLNLIKQAMRKE
jgi:hypothetical protein